MPSSKIVGNRIRVIASLHLPVHLPPQYWIQLSRELAIAVDLKPLRSEVQRYEPQGMTVITFLAESHILVTTYPEDQHVEIEIVSCKDFEPILLGGVLAVDCIGRFNGRLDGWSIYRKNKDHAWQSC